MNVLLTPRFRSRPWTATLVPTRRPDWLDCLEQRTPSIALALPARSGASGWERAQQDALALRLTGVVR